MSTAKKIAMHGELVEDGTMDWEVIVSRLSLQLRDSDS